MELFGVHRDGKSNDQLVAMSPLLTPLMNAGGIGSSGLGIAAGAGIPNLNMNTRFDAAGFGEKLFSAARDGVERMGSTANIAAVGSERMGSPMSEDAKSAVEGNLKSIGKFFRRDMSGFGGIGGRFGGRSGGSVDETIR